MDDLPTTLQAEPLKERELEILRMIAGGRSNREIADELVITLNTVRWYNKQIYGKLGVHSRTRLIVRAQELGLLDSENGDGAAPAIPMRSLTLPVNRTPFIGREEELAEVTALLSDPGCRLLTVVGAGGMGKTRFSIEAARRLAETFTHGVAFVPLSPLASADDIPSAIAQALQVYCRDSDDLLRLVRDQLYDQRLLLVLDNFEHLLNGAPLVSDLLQAVPGIKVLVTSRERLNLQEETQFQIMGLSVPASDSKGALGSSATALFIQSAQRIHPGYEPNGDDLAAILEICRLVEGMPLGIELAAAWIDMLSPAEIVQEIDRSIDFLESDIRNLPDRHRSMRVVFDSTWSRLSQHDCDVFMQLAVFRGGFTREAAERVVGADLHTLQTLIGKMLLQRTADTGRYGIHELLRMYAVGKLLQSDQADMVYDTHSTIYLGMLHEYSQDDARRLSDLAPDFENIRAAWNYAVDRRNVDGIRQALDGLYRLCMQGSRFVDELKLIDHAVTDLVEANVDGVDLTLARRLRSYRGSISGTMGLFDDAIVDLEFAHYAAHEAGDIAMQHSTAIEMGQAYRRMDRPDRAMHHLEEVLKAARERGDQHTTADVLYHLGTVVWDEGDNGQARIYYDEAVSICRELGLKDLVAVQAFHGMGESLFYEGRPTEAIAYLRESMTLAIQLGNRSYEAENLMMIAWAQTGMLGLGDYESADVDIEEALAISNETRIMWHKTCSLAGNGLICGSLGMYTGGFDAVNESIDLARGFKLARILSFALDIKGQLLLDLNLYAQAEQFIREGLEVALRSEYGFWLPRLKANLAIVRLRQGDLTVGPELLDALALAKTSLSGVHGIRALEGLAELGIANGDADQALRYADDLLSRAEADLLNEMIAQARRWRAEAFMLTGELDRAETELIDALSRADDVGRLRLLWEVHDALHRLYTMQGRTDEAAQSQEAIREIVADIRAGLPSEEMASALPEL